MPDQRYRVLVLATHVVQYASPLYRALSSDPRLETLVAYCSLQGSEPGFDPEFGVQVQWDVPLLDGYKWVHVPNKSLRPRLGHFFGLWNPGLWKLIRKGNFDAVVIYTGYHRLNTPQPTLTGMDFVREHFAQTASLPSSDRAWSTYVLTSANTVSSSDASQSNR